MSTPSISPRESDSQWVDAQSFSHFSPRSEQGSPTLEEAVDEQWGAFADSKAGAGGSSALSLPPVGAKRVVETMDKKLIPAQVSAQGNPVVKEDSWWSRRQTWQKVAIVIAVIVFSVIILGVIIVACFLGADGGHQGGGDAGFHTAGTVAYVGAGTLGNVGSFPPTTVNPRGRSNH